MECNCKETHNKVKKLIEDNKNNLLMAVQDNPTYIYKVKHSIINEIHEMLKNYQRCNCFVGQKINLVIDHLNAFKTSRTREQYSESAYNKEISGLFDKIQVTLTQ